MAKRRGSRRRTQAKAGVKLFGRGLGNTIAGAGLLSVARAVIPNFAGPFQGGVDKIAVGGVTRIAGIKGQNDLLTAGIKEVASDAIDTILIPRLRGGLGGLLGGVTQQAPAARRLVNTEALG